MTSYGDFFSTKSSMTSSKPLKFPSDLCDMVSLVCYCPQDDTIMLVVESNSHEYWIPSVKVPSGVAWLNNAVKELIQDIFGVGTIVEKMIRLYKLWMPLSMKISNVHHAVFTVPIKLETKKKSKNLYVKYKGKVKWSSYEDLLKYHNNNLLKSPEIVEFFAGEINKPLANTVMPSEYTSVANFVEVNESALVTDKNTVYEQLVDISGIDRTAQEILYKEFFLTCFPSMYLTLPSFSLFALSLGWSKEETVHLYRSADFFSRGGVSFREFIYFLAATEPAISHAGNSAELRCRYVFRYLDTNQDNLLDREEMRYFIIMLRKLRKQSLDTVNIDQDLNECYKTLGIDLNHIITLSEFVRGVGELKIRGTSQVYRAPFSVHKFIKEISDRDAKMKGRNSSLLPASIPAGQTADNPASDTAMKKYRYEMATHSVKIQKTGATINIDQFWKIENSTSRTTLGNVMVADYHRKGSTSMFDQASKSNQLLKGIRYLVQLNSRTQCYAKIETFNFNWGNIDLALFAKNLNELCSELKVITQKEPRLLRISSPVYIMGDLHGNCVDLLNFEKIFWQVGPGLCPSNLLFLGDYVDRGLFSLEVISYLFAYKIQSPKKVFLLRGNHEIRRVQQQWTFEKEVKLKFGEKLGSTVFTAINDVFDTLPLAAIVDGSVFCCHGGIPPPWVCPVVTAINDIPAVLIDPQDQSSLAWELMWNDPLRNKHMSDKVAMELLANEGFAVNYRRGTAHIFSVEALEKFLSINGFTHLVRAHEVVEAGFYLQQKGHMMTIFSSSKYCGGGNFAACILADQGKMRVLRLDPDQ